MLQLTRAATIHGLSLSSFRCAYQAKVMNTLLHISKTIVVRTVRIDPPPMGKRGHTSPPVNVVARHSHASWSSCQGCAHTPLASGQAAHEHRWVSVTSHPTKKTAAGQTW